MIRAALVLTLSASLLAGWLPGSAQARPCEPREAKVVARGDAVLVWDDGTQTVACARRSGRRLVVGEKAAVPVRHVKVAGRFVAYERHEGCFDPCYRVWVTDMRRRRSVGGSVTYPPRESRTLRRLIVDRTGRAAWLRDTPGGRDLRKLDRDGEELASSAQSIQARSLRIRGRTLFWREAGTARSFRLDQGLPCSPRDSFTLAHSDQVRVYHSDGPRYDASGRVYGCLLSRDVPVPLGENFFDTFERVGIELIETAGPYVVFDDGFSGRGGSSGRVSRVDLRDGARTELWACCRADGDGTARDLVVAPTGALAWITWTCCRQSDPAAGEYAVHKSDADGADVIVDRSPLPASSPETGIDPESLEISGDVISWRHGAETRTATLRR